MGGGLVGRPSWLPPCNIASVVFLTSALDQYSNLKQEEAWLGAKRSGLGVRRYRWESRLYHYPCGRPPATPFAPQTSVFYSAKQEGSGRGTS